MSKRIRLDNLDNGCGGVGTGRRDGTEVTDFSSQYRERKEELWGRTREQWRASLSSRRAGHLDHTWLWLHLHRESLACKKTGSTSARYYPLGIYFSLANTVPTNLIRKSACLCL